MPILNIVFSTIGKEQDLTGEKSTEIVNTYLGGIGIDEQIIHIQ